MKRIALLLLLLVCAAPAFGQSLQPPPLQSPLHIPAALSGTFAETRTNHYHGGVDLRIGGDTGIGTPVYAPADGYVSRLRVSAYDGGKMLYLTHGGNTTTVFLHLEGYAGAIAARAAAVQQQLQSYAFDTLLPPGLLPVRQGDLVAFAGNSGMSGGPHLHYEIRNTRTQQTFDPLDFGLPVADTLPPTLRGLRLLPAGPQSRLNGSDRPLYADLGRDSLRLGGPANPILLYGRCYAAVYATDLSEGSTSRNGFSRLDMWIDGRPFFQYRIDRIASGSARALNAQIDYPHYLATRQPYILTRRLAGDPLKPARTFGDGSIGFVETDTALHRLTVAVTDHAGNRTVRCFYLRNSLTPPVAMHPVPRHPSYNQHADSLGWDDTLDVSYGHYQVQMQRGTLYDNDLIVSGTSIDRRYISPILTVTPWHSSLPPHRTYQVRMSVPLDHDPDNLVICSLKGGSLSPLPTRVVSRHTLGRPGRWLEADCRLFGQFVVASDTVLPTVRPLNFKDSSTVTDTVLRLRLADNLAGVKDFKCFANDGWILGEFDGKTSTLSISLAQFRGLERPLPLRLRVLVSDCASNLRDATFQLTVPAASAPQP